MPAYTTVEIGFRKSEQINQLVEQFCKAVQIEGVLFDRVFAWGCSEDLSLKNIIEWNQAKLDMNFELGYDQDVSNDYRQFLLKGTPYTECRIFLLNGENIISFHVIVPEYEIKNEGYEVLSTMTKSVIAALPVTYVQSYDELSDGNTYVNSKKPFMPVVEYFGFTVGHIEDKTNSYVTSNLNYGKYIEVK